MPRAFGSSVDTSDVSENEAALYAAAAFYCGGFPASAYLTIRQIDPTAVDALTQACYDFLAKPALTRSTPVQQLLDALRAGDLQAIATHRDTAAREAAEALPNGPNEWIPAYLYSRLVTRFASTNIRAVLPEGSSDFWSPFVSSLLRRYQPTWEFFPSQIEAIQRGLLTRSDSFALQMPTGAGKTTLCETLLYWHTRQHGNEAAVLLVPFRSLASELRGRLVKHLNAMGLSARCAYGGTVPTGDEVRSLTGTRVLVATPEALSGLIGSDQEFMRRVSLVICDEGHLLDAAERGVSLELLLARLKARDTGAPRFVFLSAIVPNIEEINSWLGGTADTVVRSTYRPALAEFAVLRERREGSSLVLDLQMHPHEPAPTSFRLQGFLTRSDFQYVFAGSGRRRTYSYRSVKTRAIASARRALPAGTTAVFAANKRGDQGAIGLAEELLGQLGVPLTLPNPLDFARETPIALVLDYLHREFGNDWIGTRLLAAGAVLHHGDIPQETREVLERLLREGSVALVICTSTLAEGVNLPIRTLVLYSVRRRVGQGPAEALLARDIKNLAGRAGRAGSNTKGLVLCANEDDWPFVQPVARQLPHENVAGALRLLLRRLQQTLAARQVALTNELLERSPQLYALIDGIDAALIDLAAEEVGEEQLLRLAQRVAAETFAARVGDPGSTHLLETVVQLRAARIGELRSSGRLAWVRETGARARLVSVVVDQLLHSYDSWSDARDSSDPVLVRTILDWAWERREMQAAVREVYRIPSPGDIERVRPSFYTAVMTWLVGGNFPALARESGLSLDESLHLHARAISYALQTLVEQGLALLGKALEAEGRSLAEAIRLFPEHLRFGVPTSGALTLSSLGARHRRAAVMLGSAPEVLEAVANGQVDVATVARTLLREHPENWRKRLGILMYENTLQDLTSDIGEGPASGQSDI